MKKLGQLMLIVLLAGFVTVVFGILPTTAVNTPRNYMPVVLKPANTPTFTPTPTSTPTPTATATEVAYSYGNMEITAVQYLGTGSSKPDQYVEIKNVDNHPIQLQNWTLRNLERRIFVFPAYVMWPDQICRVYTNQVIGRWCGFSYGSNTPIWNESGDCAELRNSAGLEVDTFCYP